MRAARRLIVCADDFGMSAGVNAAIMRAHREGILTQTSLMVRGEAAAEAVELARATPTLAVGLHVALVQGRCAAPPEHVPLLARPDGRLRSHPIWAGVRYFFTPGARAQVRREIVAQLDAFAATGLPLSHVDGHVTMHMHPVALDLLLEVAARYRIRALRLARDPLRQALRFDARHAPRKLCEATAFGALARWAAPRLARAGVRSADRLYGLHQTGQVSEAYLLHVIAALPPGVSELYCHPALLDDEASRWRPAGYAGEQEVAALCSPRVRSALAAADIALTSYRQLAEQAEITPRGG